MAKVVNYGDPNIKKISLRISEKEYRFCMQYCDYYNITLSEYIRRLLWLQMYKGVNNENHKPDFDNIL